MSQPPDSTRPSRKRRRPSASGKPRPRGQKRARVKVSPARVAAARTLLGVEGGAHADELLAQLAPSDPRDRALAWHLALGVLRRQGTLDRALKPHLKRPLDRLDAPVRVVLRLGVFERWFARTRDHAAVSQAVELTRLLGAGRASGFVNAVLRKIPTEVPPLDPFDDLPPWLAERLRAWPDWVARLHEPSPVCGVWTHPDQPVPGVADGPACAAGEPVPGAFRLLPGEGSIDARPGFEAGAFWIMDPASAAVADLLHHALPAPSTVLDACAAPGGKALRLAAHGHTVTAVDLEPSRLARIHENTARTGLSVDTTAHDWESGPASLGQFQGVLVDAPCSAIGVIRRHPEIRWRRSPADPASMAVRQRTILRNAAQHVAPGGVLVYAVCSPLPEEGLAVAESLSGFTIERHWSTAPPSDDEDAFQAVVLRQIQP